MAIPSGTRFSRYEIRSSLGTGGMGEVYLAWDSQLERSIALKVLPAELAADPQRLQRFLQEARAASKLKSVNVAHIYEIGESTEGLRFIAMEYVEGQLLSEKISGQPLPVTEITRLGIGIARALEEAHSKGITHRDIKPQNIIVTREGEVKVLDFGLAKVEAKAVQDTEKQRPDSEFAGQVETSPGLVIGTPFYMSPEQAMGRGVDHRTDIFSLGVVLYEMATGRLPFSGTSLTETLDKIAHSQPEAIARLNYNVPPELEVIVKKALRKKRDERYQSAKELFIDLGDLQRELEFASHKEHSVSDGPEGNTVIIPVGGQPTVIDATELPIPSTSAVSPAPALGSGEVSGAGAAATVSAPSIAVLPFVNMSADPENEFFCDGLAEELLNALAKIDGLKVAARTSAFSFKGRNVNINDIGQTLNVSTVLEGSVRKSGQRLRITAQLINASDGYHLWSERYDREMQDIFDVQDEITIAVVDALKIKLLGEDRADVLKRYTDNTEAYELYLKGRYFYNKYTGQGWNTAIEYYERATQKEPEYAPAYAGISHCLGISWYYGILSAGEALPRWRAATNRALEIDERLAEAHMSRAADLFFYQRNWVEAERRYTTAIDLSPNNADAHQWYGMFLASRARFDEAIAEVRVALELDPLSLLINLHAGWVYLLAGRTDDVLRQAEKLKEIEPNFANAFYLEGTVQVSRGMYREGLEALQKSIALGGDQITLAVLGAAYGLVGEREAAAGVLNQLLETRKRQYVAAVNIARVYGGMGEIDQAFAWLEKAIEEQNGELVFLNVQSKVGIGGAWGQSIRTDPRFDELLRKLDTY